MGHCDPNSGGHAPSLSWLVNTHASHDPAVWAAYGWPEPPEETDDETILARLLALNLERAAGAG